MPQEEGHRHSCGDQNGRRRRLRNTRGGQRIQTKQGGVKREEQAARSRPRRGGWGGRQRRGRCALDAAGGRCGRRAAGMGSWSRLLQQALRPSDRWIERPLPSPEPSDAAICPQTSARLASRVQIHFIQKVGRFGIRLRSICYFAGRINLARYFAGSASKSLRQFLQHSLISCP